MENNNDVKLFRPHMSSKPQLESQWSLGKDKESDAPTNPQLERQLSFSKDKEADVPTKPQLQPQVSFNKYKEEVNMGGTTHHVLTSEDLLLAATLIVDAKNGRNMNFKTDVKSVRSYLLFQHWIFKVILHLFIWGNMALAIFEKPAVAGLALPYWATMVIEMVFIGYYLFRFFHNMQFNEPTSFWTDSKNITLLGTIVLIILDMICYIIWINVDPTGNAVRWSRVLRPFLIINFPEGRQIRKAVRNIRKTLPDIVHILVLFLCSLAIFALMALKLLQRRDLFYPDKTPYFQNYIEAYWDMYVLVTTANNPDVMMPAYDTHKFFAVFFIVFSIVNQYIFMSIVLASVYNNYKRRLKDEVRNLVYMKRKLLAQAFDILKEPKADGHHAVSKAHWHAVMKLVLPSCGETQRDLLLYVLDEEGNDHIARSQFLKVADLLNIRLTEVKDRITCLEQTCTECFNSRPSEMLKTAVRHKIFRVFFDFAILVNAICIGFSLETAEWFFLGLFSLEIVLKMYTHGPFKFFRSAWNTFDFIVILAAGVATLIETITAQSPDEARGRTLDFILVLRVLRLIRLIGSIERFQIIITTVVNIGPSILTYGGVIFVLYYIYAIIGMELYHGLFHFPPGGYINSTTDCGNPKLAGSEFAIKRYCNNNFNDIISSIVLLFELMVVNQWHVLTHGFVLITNRASRLYFISFHLLCVVLLLNTFTAFVLEVFLLEYNLSKSTLADSIEAKIKDMGLSKGMKPVGKRLSHDSAILVENLEVLDEIDTATVNPADIIAPHIKHGTHHINILPPPGVDDGCQRYFKLRRNNKKRLDVLLQAMFQEELEEEQAFVNVSSTIKRKKLTLETADT